MGTRRVLATMAIVVVLVTGLGIAPVVTIAVPGTQGSGTPDQTVQASTQELHASPQDRAAIPTTPGLGDGTPNETEYVVRFNSTDPSGTVETAASSLKTQADRAQAPFLEVATESPYVEVKRSFWLVNAVLIEVNTDVISKENLTAVQHVDRVHPNFAVHPTGATATTTAASSSMSGATTGAEHTVGTQQTDPTYTYGLEMVRAPETWSTYDTKGQGAGVAVLDSGVDPNHTAISLAGWAEFDSDGNMIDSQPSDPDGHGTHVAGTVAGGTVDGTAIGVAPQADLYGVKVLNDSGTGSITQVIEGMQWAIDNSDVDILQLSLGTDGYYEEYIDVVRNARATGHLVVAAAGNSGAGTSSSPANVYESLAVGAVDANENVEGFSSGETIDTDVDWSNPPSDWPAEYIVPDLTAPGSSVQSAEAGTTNGTTEISGTSMAAPHVAGAAALALSAANGTLDDTQLQQALVASATHPDGSDTVDDRYGNGIVDSYAATTRAVSDAFVTGNVTGNGDPIPDATVSSSAGTTTTTDTTGAYTLFVPEGSQTITVDAFGWRTAQQDINPQQGDTTQLDVALTGPVADAATTTDAPQRIAPGNTIDLSFRTTNVANYTLSVRGETIGGDTVPDSALSLTVNGNSSVGVNETVTVDPAAESLSVSVSTPPDMLATLQFTHQFAGENLTRTLTTRTTTVQPATLTLPQDYDPTSLQSVIDFAADGTTIALDSGTTFSATATQSQPAALTVDRQLTLRGEGGTATIDVTEQTSSTDTTGLRVGGVSTAIENLRIQGAVDTGIAMTGTDATVDDVTVTGARTGAHISDGERFRGATIRNVATAIRVTGSVGSIADVTATATTNGLLLSDAVQTIDGVTVDLPDAGTGLSITDASVSTVTDLTVRDPNRGIVLTGAGETTIDGSTITGATTAMTLTDGTADVSVTETTVDGGTIAFGDVTTGSNTLSLTYDGRPLTVTGQSATLSPSAEPAPFPDYGPIGAFYDLEKTASSGELDLTIGYSDRDARAVKEGTLAFYRYDSARETWDRVPGTTVDTTAQTVSVSMDSFSTVGVYGEGVPYFAVTDLVASTAVRTGERFDVFATIENQGAVAGSQTVTYTFDGTAVDTRTLTLDSGDSRTVALTHVTAQDLADGSYAYSVGSANETTHDTVTVGQNVPPSNISISNVSIADRAFSADQPLSVNVTLANTGQSDGTYRLVLTADGERIADRVLLVNATSERTVTLTHQFRENGAYAIALNNESLGTVTVDDRPTTAQPGFGPVAGLAGLLSLLTILALRRRG